MKNCLRNITLASLVVIAGSAMAQDLLSDGTVDSGSLEEEEITSKKAYFPYDLNITNDEDNHVITFRSTGDAKNAILVLTDALGEETRIELGEVEKGENTFMYNSSDLESGNYKWAIEFYGYPVKKTDIVYSDDSGLSAVRGTALPINDTNSPSFGYTIVGHGMHNGFDIYNPDGEKVATRVYKDDSIFGTNQSSPMGAAEFDGKAVFCDWNDAGSELTVVDPIAAIDEDRPSLYTMLEGEKSNTGAHKVGDTYTVGGSPCIAFQELDGEQKAYMFDEDVNANKLVRFNVSENKTICTAAEKVFNNVSGNLLMLNTCVELATFDKGVFVTQSRAEGKVDASTPTFILVKHDGEIVYNNSKLNETDSNYTKTSASGIALSYDKSLLAVATTMGIDIFSVVFDDDDTFIINKLVNYETLSLNSVYNRVKFDIAGNLHIYSRDKGGYKVVALANNAPFARVDAPVNSVMITGKSSVKNLLSDDADNSAVVYYNLSGQRVSANNLSKGVYIKVVGNKAKKIMVK
jgi:hypothetical protein